MNSTLLSVLELVSVSDVFPPAGGALTRVFCSIIWLAGVKPAPAAGARQRTRVKSTGGVRSSRGDRRRGVVYVVVA